jgi:hemoglobin/transferrin/lactoferrin receptor protein
MKARIFIFIFTVVLFLMYGPAASAQDKEKKEQAKKKEVIKEDAPIIVEIEVVARRMPEDTFKTDRSVSVMDKETIKEQTPRTVPEALFETPGAFVQQTNAGGGSPIIRGMGGPQVLIAVDGIRFNNSVYRTGPVQYLNLMDPFSVGQIEVLRGPGSVLYGSDAMGGVIQLNTLSSRCPTPQEIGKFNFSGNLLSRYQSTNTGSTFHGDFAAGYNGWSILGGVSYKRFNDLRGGKGVGVQPYSGYDNTSAIAKLNRRFSHGFLKDWDFTVGYLYSFIDHAGRTDKLYDQNSLQFYDNKDHLVYARLDTLFPAIGAAGNITLSYQDFFERKDTEKVKNDYKTILKTTCDNVTAGTLGLDLNMTSRLKENVLRLNYGGMVYRDSVSAERFTKVPDSDWIKVNDQDYPDGSTYTNYGLYTLLEWEPFRPVSGNHFRLGGGWRFHGVSAKVPARLNLPAVDFSFTGHVFLVSAQYLAGDRYNMSLTYSQGFRAPNLNEAAMLGDTGQFFHIPNDELRPEYSNTLELLTRGRFGTLTLSCAGYVSFLEDFIKREGTLWEGKSKIDGKDVVQNVNAGKGILWGTEGNFLLGLAGSWSLSGNIAYTWGEEKITNGKDIPLTRIPPLFGQFKLRFDFLKRSGQGGWQGFAETYIRAAAKQDRLSAEDLKDSRVPKGGTPGWWTWNIRVGVSMWNHLRWQLALDNILNKKYKYHGSGIYNPGATVVLTLEVY